MTSENRPRRGSLAFRPRKRATALRVASWPAGEAQRLQGFAGYKAGMTHLTMLDDVENSVTKGQEVSVPATVLEVPPVFVFGIRAYKKTPYGEKVFADACAKIADRYLARFLPNGDAQSVKKIDDAIDSISDIRLLVATQPKKIGLKKTPEILEVAAGGKSTVEKLEYCKALLGKEAKISDFCDEGEFVDIISITKGKGWQGAVKRFGVSKQRRKATGKVRHVGSLGPWHPAKVMYTVPMAGQMGFHKRTEFNKRVLKISDDGSAITPKGGFVGYGDVRGAYALIAGSIGGPRKRLIRLRRAMRAKHKPKKPEISYVSIESKQGA